MTPPPRSAWLAMALFAIAVWFVGGSAGSGSPAAAEPTLRTPRLGAQLVAMHDPNDDAHNDEHGEDHDHDHEEGEEEHEEFDFDEEIEGLEFQRAEVELRQADLRATFGGLELIQELTQIAESRDASAVMAIVAASDTMDAGDLIPFLTEVVDKTSSSTVRRVAQMKLAEAYDNADQPSKAIEQVRALALGQ